MAKSIEGEGLCAQLLSRCAGPTPRCTSYPTADRLRPLHDYEPWRALAHARSLSLCVHIPFCHPLCYFCACSKVITHQCGLASGYLQQML